MTPANLLNMLPWVAPQTQTFSAPLIDQLVGRVAEIGLDVTAMSVDATAAFYERSGLLLTKLMSGVRESGVVKTTSERDAGRPPFYLTKRDHFIISLDGKADLLLGELAFDRVAGVSDDSGLVRGDEDPVLLYTHGMFMDSNFGLFPIDGRGPVPNIDTIRTLLGFFAYLGFRVFYLHMRNCVHVQNRYVRNNSGYVTDPRNRPDLLGVRYDIPEGTTFDVMEENDIGSALRYIVKDLGHERIIALAHSMSGGMFYDYLGRGLPYSRNIAGFVPMCSPLRWSFDDQGLIRILIKIGRNAEAINHFLESTGSRRRADPLAFIGERVRTGSEVMAGFSPAMGVFYELGMRMPVVRDALNTLRNTQDRSERVTSRTVGKFFRKCLEPMPPMMVEHFMRMVGSPSGALTAHDGRNIADVLPNIDIPVLAVAGEKDGLAHPERNIAPVFERVGSRQKRILKVRNGDHFTTVAGRKAPKATWFEIAKWMHEMGLYSHYDESALARIYFRHFADR